MNVDAFLDGLDIWFALWCVFMVAAWFFIKRCIGYKRFNTFTLFLPIVFLTNGIFVLLSSDLNAVMIGHHIDQTAFRRYWTSIVLMYIAMPLGICMVNQFKKLASGPDDRFLATPRNPRNTALYVGVLVLLSIIFIAKIFSDGIALNLRSYFMGFTSYDEYTAHRLAFADSTRGWSYYLYHKLPYGIAPLACVLIWSWERRPLIWRLALTAIIAFAVVQTGHKLPLVFMAGIIVASRYAIRHEMRLTQRLYLLLGFLAVLVVTVALPLMYMSQGMWDYRTALYWAVERVVGEPHRGLQLYFDIYPQHHPHLHGLSSSTVASALGAERYLPASEYIPNVFFGIQRTSWPSLFIGEGWADFGYAGVVFYSMVVGGVLQAYNVWYYNQNTHYLEDSALLLCIAVGSVHLLASPLLAAFLTYGLGTSLIMYVLVRGVRLNMKPTRGGAEDSRQPHVRGALAPDDV